MNCISDLVPESILQGSIILNIVGFLFGMTSFILIISHLLKKKKVFDKKVIILLVFFAVIFLVGLFGSYYIMHYSNFHQSNSSNCQSK